MYLSLCQQNPFSSFHWLVVLIVLLLLLFHNSLSALHVHWEEYWGFIFTRAFLSVAWDNKNA